MSNNGMRVIGPIAGLAALAVLVPTALAETPSLVGIGYICHAEQRQPVQTPGKLVMLSGMGSGGFTVRAGTPEAQDWLNYGLKLYHAFYHDDAKAAFAKAVALDPDCALCAWGQALGLGPTLNYEVSAADTTKALVVATRAEALAHTPLERDLATALVQRYQPGLAPNDRELRYGDTMAALAEQHPDEPDLASLAAHALITPARQGGMAGMPRALALLKHALARNRDDTAAIHYFIHAAEYAGQAADALPYAERLAALAPNASHLVHMASHTLFHIGRYEDVAVLNAKAMTVDADYATAMAEPGAPGEPRYYAHNMLFGVFGALMAGDHDLSLKYADHAPIAFPLGSDPVRQSLVVSRTLVAYGRYAPRKALALPPPTPGSPAFYEIYWRYARGEAQAALGDADGVLTERRLIDAIPVTDGGGIPELKQIAAKVLAGRAAMLQGNPQGAARLYGEAADIQDKAFTQLYDPPPWWYPVRRSQAAAELRAGDYAAAAAQARRSLEAWPGDGLALRVLGQAERKLGDKGSADRQGAEAKRAWSGAVDAVSLDLI
jgi:tetratricopeptide (TPR) repeat protein